MLMTGFRKTRSHAMLVAFVLVGQRASAQSAAAPTLDFDFFKTRVQTVFLDKRPNQARCILCHSAVPGNRAHPLLVPLSPGSSSWSEDDSRKNFAEVSKSVTPGSEKSMLLVHHLATAAGGDAVTNGGKFYASQNDPDWQVLKTWVMSGAPAGGKLRGGPRLFQTNSAGDNIHIIDPTTNTIVGEITGIELSHGIVVRPDGKQIYVSDEAKATVDVVDGTTLQVTKEIPLTGRPNNIALAPDGRRLYVGIRQAPGGVDVIDTATLRKIKNIPTDTLVHNPYVTPDGKYVIVGSIEGKIVQVIDLKTDEVAWSVSMGAGVRPLTMSVNPDGSVKWLFVQLSDFNGFVVVDFATRKEIRRVQNPDLAPGKTAVPSPTEISHGMVVTPDQKTLLVCSRINSALYSYSLPDLKVQGTADLSGKGAAWMTLDSDVGRAYIAQTMSDDVSVVDIKSMREVAHIPVGAVPKRNILGMLP